MKIKLWFLLLLFVPLLVSAEDENLNVLSGIKFSDVENALFHYYADKVFLSMDQRAKEVATCKTVEDWQKRQEKVRDLLHKVVGDFPARTPLNAKITGVLNKDGYRVEKIVFESQPNFFVTGALYIPNDLKGKAPAILFTSGHAKEAFRWHPYQQVCINLVKKGFIVFAYDPLSQGERTQYYDSASKKSKVGSCSAEHTYEGNQCVLIGKSLARYMIWDGMRAIDYLLTRPEVDETRLGVTGHSGGGTQSSYIAAFDDRIAAVAPECFIISIRRLWETIGPQDAEQIFYHGVANGLDFADLLEVRAPKPALQITTTRDFFSIQGARETGKEVKNVYRIFNAEGDFSRIEDDAPHKVTKKNRVKRNAFFQKSLNLPGNSDDNPVDFLTDEELQVTKTGQVSTSLAGETVFSLNKKEAELLLTNLDKLRKNKKKYKEKILSSAKSICGYEKPIKIDEVVFRGRYQRNGYVVEKYYLKGNGNYPIPFLLFIPHKLSGATVLYLDSDGKESQAHVDGEIEWFVKKGHAVLTADLIGFGEMKQEIPSRSSFGAGLGGLSDPHWGSPVALGGSIVGLHAGDIQRLVLFIKKRDDLNGSEIYAVAKGDLCPALLHAAAFENSFSKIALFDPLISYRTVVLNKYYKIAPMSPIIPGVLEGYDLPDLAAVLASNRLMVVNARDQLGKLASDSLVNNEIDIVKKSFKSKNNQAGLMIFSTKKEQKSFDLYSKWLK